MDIERDRRGQEGRDPCKYEGASGRPGLLEVHVRTNPLASSNAEVMLDTTLENEEMLKGYQKHPAHVEVANTYVRPYTDVRMCMDYEV